MRKIEATLLMAALIVSVFTVITPVGAARLDLLEVPEDYPTIQAAVDVASDGDTILVGAGEWHGAIVDKAVEIKGKKGAIIVDGPEYPGLPLHYGFLIVSGGSGATISRFTFRGGPIEDTDTYLAFPIFSRDGVNDVTVERNEIYDALQGITNWHGDNWVIQHNAIYGLWTYHGGGLGILVGSNRAYDPDILASGTATGNLVAHNIVQAHIEDIEPDGAPRTYSCSGIVILSDARFREPDEVYNNEIVNNKVMVTGTDTYAISLELVASGEIDPEYAQSLVHDNTVASNELRGSANPIGLIPPELEEVNTISLKPGKKIGHG